MTAPMQTGLIYITGIAGVGKSTVKDELESKGYTACEVDDNFAGFFNIETGERSFTPLAKRTPEWYQKHEWIFMKEPLEKIKKLSQSQLVFLCGTAWNEKNYWGIFKQVFALVLDNKTLEYRLKTRSRAEAWGKSDYELAYTMARNKSQNEEYYKLGAIIIDAALPTGKVVDKILQNCLAKCYD